MARIFDNRVWVETDRPAFPPVCVCCCEASEVLYHPTPPERRKGLPAHEELLALPYCKICEEHRVGAQTFGTAQMVALNIAVWGAAIPLMAGLSELFMVIGPALGGAYYSYARNKMQTVLRLKPTCAGRGAVMRALWFRKETYIFSFVSSDYAERFRLANPGCLTPEDQVLNNAI